MKLSRKLLIATVISLAILLYLFISSPDYIINSAEKKMGFLTHVGADKYKVIQYLDDNGYGYEEKSTVLDNYYFPTQVLSSRVCLDSEWGCEYEATISAHKEKIGFADPRLHLNFAFDENERLVDYSANVNYTFL